MKENDMKKNMLSGLLAAVMLLLVSCAGTSTSGGGGAVGYFPVRSARCLESAVCAPLMQVWVTATVMARWRC